MKDLKSNHVYLYGVDHSPWVQGVWYTLKYLGYEVTLSSIPPSFGWVKNNGITFPVAKFDDGQLIYDSFKIYDYLSKRHPNIPDLNNKDEYQVMLEKLFLNYSPQRGAKGKNLKFFLGWMKMRERPSSIKGAFLRGLIFFYYFFLIKLSLILMSSKKNEVSIKESLKKNLSFWDGLLENSKWISGDEVGYLDFSLFGHIECIASGPTDEFIPKVRDFKNIQSWLKEMLKINKQVPPLYSKRVFDHGHYIEQDRKNEMIFILGFVFGVTFLPFTIVFILYLFHIRTRGHHHSGAIIKGLKKT